MSKIGRFVTTSQGAHCEIVLDSGERIIVNHDRGTFTGEWLTVEALRLIGSGTDRLFARALDNAEGRAVVAALARPGEATALGAFVRYVEDCRSVAEVKARCARLVRAAAGSTGEGDEGSHAHGS